MFKVFLLLLAGQSAFAQTVEKEFAYQGGLRPTNCFPSFDHGYLIIDERSGGITLRPPNGASAITLSVREPADGAPLSNGAVDTDGFIAATVNMGAVWGLALFRPDGKQERFIETTPLMPLAVRFGPDHSIWTAVLSSATLAANPDYEILRNYSREGRPLGAYLPRAMFGSKALLIPPNTGLTLLHVATDRVGLFLDASTKVKTPLWLEMDMSGNVISHLETSEYRPFGLTARGSIYGFDGPGTGFAEFDRATRKWTPLSIPTRGGPLGIEGEQLVFLDSSGLAQWVSVPH